MVFRLSHTWFGRYIHSNASCWVRAMEGTVANPTYHDAIQRLNSTQTGFKVLEERRRLAQKLDSSGIEQMRQWLRHTKALDRLNIVHVAGTKGKGSTCAFVNSILEQYRATTGAPEKVGMYTSPHLVAVRERIQINSKPVSEELFTKYFFEVWNALESSAVREGLDPAMKPSYFRFLTLMSFHLFLREEVTVAIYEVGVGGELDSTNIIEQPGVTGITSLGIDHVATLGHTIDKISWHKAGIMKTGCPAFTVTQAPEAMSVLKKRAQEKGVTLGLAEIIPALRQVDIKPAEDFQLQNASLAVILASEILRKLNIAPGIDLENLPVQVVEGLQRTVWKGRCQLIDRNNQQWHLDGAHTHESLQVASSWFGRLCQNTAEPRILIFNQQSQLRDVDGLLSTVHDVVYNRMGLNFQHVMFCTNITYKSNEYKVADMFADFVDKNVDPEDLKSLVFQKKMADCWSKLDPASQVSVLPSLQEAVELVDQIDSSTKGTKIFVCGSFRLVGGMLSLLDQQVSDVR
ncbi:folylpolyglutamate synthetase, putative [Trichophyton benhamiae CBS 112371]|uniref:Folylpolyglutamate synthase n=1 Tax=Arthroderma benhamiae (strain ATCC MYA-4681 / CBS 112371) TaxID=663331 RepID=D4AUI2_ARTBC|nr:folylpolyglutamate synthetase, putative [Trichophyton benhamiae CBS 112371]EFE33147.1 folylpolyglutamate synthetase, putative [Trichophyton benhamiae CBS 112371]